MRSILVLLSLVYLAQANFEHPLIRLGGGSGDFGRIVHGEIVKPHSIPYQAALHLTVAGSNQQSFCGGSLISRNYVLTAAHCADGMSQIEVVLGAHSVLEKEDTQVRMVSREFMVHKGWNRNTLQNDIAIVKLPKPAPLNEYIQLVNLPSFSEASASFDKLPARASGWGKILDSTNSISPVLRKAELNIISNVKCNLKFLGMIKAKQICSAGKGSTNVCNGDSGGPLVVSGDKQVGIASFVSGLGCEAGWPAGYCRVSKYLDWIAANTDAKINQ